MSFILMTTGISWRVVEAKWEGVRAAFGGFDVDKVAAMRDEDVERLMADARMIHNRRKIRAIIDNAAKFAETDKTYGGFDKYLQAQESYEKKVAALRRDFSFMGDSTAYYFLARVGETVPEREEPGVSHGHQGSRSANLRADGE
jgi:3-methyladenine DNA glycosylase Tag